MNTHVSYFESAVAVEQKKKGKLNESTEWQRGRTRAHTHSSGYKGYQRSLASRRIRRQRQHFAKDIISHLTNIEDNLLEFCSIFFHSVQLHEKRWEYLWLKHMASVVKLQDFVHVAVGTGQWQLRQRNILNHDCQRPLG